MHPGNFVSTEFAPPYTVRRITAADGRALQGLYVGALRDAPYAFGSHDARPAEYFAQTAARHAVSNASTTFLMEYTKIPIGMIRAYLGSEAGMSGETDEVGETGDLAQRGYVRGLWVSFRHRRAGAGALLLNSACQWLFETGALEVCAWLAPGNIQVVSFYQRLGFRPGSTLLPAPLHSAGTDRVFSRVRVV